MQSSFECDGNRGCNIVIIDFATVCVESFACLIRKYCLSDLGVCFVFARHLQNKYTAHVSHRIITLTLCVCVSLFVFHYFRVDGTPGCCNRLDADFWLIRWHTHFGMIFEPNRHKRTNTVDLACSLISPTHSAQPVMHQIFLSVTFWASNCARQPGIENYCLCTSLQNS